MDTPTLDATPAQTETTRAAQAPCRPAYEWTKDSRIVRTCK